VQCSPDQSLELLADVHDTRTIGSNGEGRFHLFMLTHCIFNAYFCFCFFFVLYFVVVVLRWVVVG
jgi:hypothetical protein